MAQKYLERYALAPIEANFNLDAKDGSLALADFVRINSRQHQDFYGNNLDLLMQITKRKEALVGTTWAFTARQFAFSSNAKPDRPVDIAVDTWDLDLKAAHDEQYGPASAGDIVIVTIKAGVRVTASSTSLYALTNPSTWAAGVIVKLVIESGAVVAGLGGAGGWNDGVSYHANGYDGGSCAQILFPIEITNNGTMGSGGGGGGISGGIDVLGIGLYFGGGAAGGGGAAIGGVSANYPDSDYASSPDHVITTHPTNATVGGNITGGAGGESLITHGATTYHAYGGAGGNLGSAGGTGTGTYAGVGGNAGAYCIHGNSFITWIATGTRYGAIV